MVGIQLEIDTGTVHFIAYEKATQNETVDYKSLLYKKKRNESINSVQKWEVRTF